MMGSALKKKEVVTHATTWEDLEDMENMTLNEVMPTIRTNTL